MSITCISVLGGWQTSVDGRLFGPVFNKTTDLWAWQAANRDTISDFAGVLEALRMQNEIINNLRNALRPLMETP